MASEAPASGGVSNEEIFNAIKNNNLEILQQNILTKKDIVNGDGHTPLHYAAYIGNDKALEIIYGASPDLNKTDKYGQTPLHLAAKEGHINAVKPLTNKYPGMIRVASADKALPLHLAAEIGNLEIVQVLLTAAPDTIDRETKDGFTPLQFATAKGALDVVKYLVTQGANLLPEIGKKSPLEISKAGGFKDIESFLEDPLPIVTAENPGCQYEYAYEDVEIDAGKKKHKHKKRKDGDEEKDSEKEEESPAAPPKLQTVRRRLRKRETKTTGFQRGPAVPVQFIQKISKVKTDQFGRTEIHQAIHANRFNDFKELLAKGGSLTTQDKNGETPVMCAIKQQRVEILRYLKEQGKVDRECPLTDCTGRTVDEYWDIYMIDKLIE